MKQSSRVGIIGDGQLALMLAEALHEQQVGFMCLSESQESPMWTFFPEAVTSDPLKFQQECSIFSLENEFHSIPELKTLLGDKLPLLFPTPESYSHFADKISQRKFYELCDIPSPQWMALESQTDLPKLKRFNYPFVVKASKGGYDGKGVRVVHSENELEEALKAFKFLEGNALLIEEKVHIQIEVAQGFLRSKEGHCTLLPLVETVQENGVCNLVKYPADVSSSIKNKISAMLKQMMDQGLVGIFNFEFFIDQNGKVLINEGAPRTHNSQHLTLDASQLSQFDLLAMYLTDPSRAPSLIETLPSVMINILGKRDGAPSELSLPRFTDVKIHSKLYGKKKSSPGRKLGHVNVVDKAGQQDLLAIGQKILKEYDL